VRTKASSNVVFLLFGVHFGFALSRSGATEYNLIHDMFRFRDLKLMYLMALAMAVGALGMLLLRAQGNRTISGEPVKVREAKPGWNNVYGGLIFGVGWALSGACPGTVLGQIGEGRIYAFFTVLGLLAGTYAYARLQESKP